MKDLASRSKRRLAIYLLGQGLGASVVPKARAVHFLIHTDLLEPISTVGRKVAGRSLPDFVESALDL